MDKHNMQEQDLLMAIAEPEINFEDYLGVIFRRKLFIIITFFLIFIPFFYIGLIQPSYYSATLIAMLDDQQKDERMNPSQFMFRNQNAPQNVGYYNLIVQSEPFRKDLAERIQIALKEEENLNITPQRAAEIAHLPMQFEQLQGSFLQGSEVIQSACQLRATAGDPVIVYQIVNVGFEVLRDKAIALENQRADQMLKYIIEQKQLLEEQIIENENEIQLFRNKTGISVGDDLAGVEREAQKLQVEMLNARTTWQLEEAKQKAIEEELQEYDLMINKKYNVRINYDTLALKGQYEELVKKKNKYMQNPSVFKKELEQVESQIADITNRAARQIIGQLSGGNNPSLQLDVTHYTELIRKRDESVLTIKMMKLQEKYYQQLYDRYRVANPEVLQQKTEMARLSLTRSVLNRAYNFFVEREQQEKLTTISNRTELKLISPADKPSAPLPRTTKKFWSIGFLLGLVLSFSMAFFIELFDTTLKTPEDVKKHLLVPTMGIIPKMIETLPQAAEMNVDPYLITFIKPNHQVSEAYRTLRTNLEHIDPYHKLKSLLVTSPSPYEGKSISISNLSVLFAQKDMRVLLVDLDLRKPKIHTIFNMDRKPGLLDALDHPELDYHQYIQISPVPNLHVFTVGGQADRPAEILGSDRFKSFFETLKNDFDIVLVDTPPVNVVTDAALISTYVDGVLLVMAALQTNRNSARYCLELMNRVNANVLGILLNKILISKRYGSYGYYYYKRYYKSYYSYYHTSPD